MQATAENITATAKETMVVILTYMRSGSTFTGDIVQRNPDVFYVFEPLHSVERFLRGKVNLMFFNHSQPSRRISRSQKTLENFLTCNMRDVDVFTLGQAHMSNSIDTRAYHSCKTHNAGILGTLDCLPVLEQPCVRSRVSCVKTIRFNMTDMTYLMDKYRNIKIVHLIRDPRATLRSQKSVGEFSWDSLDIHAEKLCQRAKRDFDVSSKMKSLYPGRILTLRYEDLAERPFVMTEQIYRFIGLDLTPSIRDYVQNITNASDKACVNIRLCTRKKSTKIISKWRTSLSYNQVSAIDNICEPLYKVMGYLPVNNEQNLHNLSVPMYTAVPEEKSLEH
ncbi:carbohydrate sulfotransferase 1-like [Haliotis cracherodii]|uniref:carbohydrate sulfotransferase 1-like n=1 Tax=Haliotis cracherodii TaxID=6455 RepID=UPI0039EBAB7A